jgi:2-polyprenyl-3-methyl-5-hydroxy-6-metoxy-1,4-benzoquinol methylase
MKRLEVTYSLTAIDVLVSLARYNFVNRVINDPNLSVLDYGSGTGYGSRALAERFRDVTSFDIYPDGYLPQVPNVCQDLSKIRERQYDVITCFEVIEHMDEPSQRALIDTLHDLTSPHGTIFLSTVRKITPPPTENRRVEHVRELDFGELHALCAERFHNIYTFGQIDQIISTFYKENHYHFVFMITGKRLNNGL